MNIKNETPVVKTACDFEKWYTRRNTSREVACAIAIVRNSNRGLDEILEFPTEAEYKSVVRYLDFLPNSECCYTWNGRPVIVHEPSDEYGHILNCVRMDQKFLKDNFDSLQEMVICGNEPALGYEVDHRGFFAIANYKADIPYYNGYTWLSYDPDELPYSAGEILFNLSDHKIARLIDNNWKLRRNLHPFDKSALFAGILSAVEDAIRDFRNNESKYSIGGYLCPDLIGLGFKGDPHSKTFSVTFEVDAVGFETICCVGADPDLYRTTESFCSLSARHYAGLILNHFEWMSRQSISA